MLTEEYPRLRLPTCHPRQRARTHDFAALAKEVGSLIEAGNAISPTAEWPGTKNEDLMACLQ